MMIRSLSVCSLTDAAATGSRRRRTSPPHPRTSLMRSSRNTLMSTVSRTAAIPLITTTYCTYQVSTDQSRCRYSTDNYEYAILHTLKVLRDWDWGRDTLPLIHRQLCHSAHPKCLGIVHIAVTPQMPYCTHQKCLGISYFAITTQITSHTAHIKSVYGSVTLPLLHR